MVCKIAKSGNHARIVHLTDMCWFTTKYMLERYQSLLDRQNPFQRAGDVTQISAGCRN